MLDGRTRFLLETLCRVCGEGSYQIVEEGELLKSFPAVSGVDETALRNMLWHLRDLSYIDVRFDDAGVYCVRPLPEGRLYFERLTEGRTNAKRRRREQFLWAFCGSFLGSLLGGGVAVLFSLL